MCRKMMRLAFAGKCGCRGESGSFAAPTSASRRASSRDARASAPTPTPQSSNSCRRVRYFRYSWFRFMAGLGGYTGLPDPDYPLSRRPASPSALWFQDQAVSGQLFHFFPRERQREITSLGPLRQQIGVVLAARLSRLARGARRQRPVPVGEVEQLAVGRPVNLPEALVVAGVVRRVSIA